MTSERFERGVCTCDRGCPLAAFPCLHARSGRGGGELEPATALGRIVAAVTVMLGILCFALPVGILGRVFYDEVRRRDFVVTFAMVARIPLFARLDPASLVARRAKIAP